MITAKQKAEELVNRFKSEARQDIYGKVLEAYEKKFGNNEKRTFKKVCDFSSEYHAKQCAIICVEEIISTYTIKTGGYFLLKEEVDYWKQVKTEIENL